VKKTSAFENRELILSEDGSSSFYLPDLDETYHNRRGALTESAFIFIDKGLRAIIPERKDSMPIKVLEVGMGTALNVLLTQRFAESEQIQVEMVTLEPYPLVEREWTQLNYGSILGMEKELENLHKAPWDSSTKLSPCFEITKLRTKLEEFRTDGRTFDVIYMDAYAPSRQDEIWSTDNLSILFKSLNRGGSLVTYCAQGQFKRNLKLVGFQAEHPPGPLGKKEMTVARKEA